MNDPETPIQWAPRVSREKILELYIKVAAGNNDEELIDEVADAFYDRCMDLIRIAEKRFACPVCRKELPQLAHGLENVLQYTQGETTLSQC